MTKYSEAGKGGAMRPTDHNKWSSGYDNIQWTKEEDEEFNRIQDRIGSERAVAKVRNEEGAEVKESSIGLEKPAP
jgi:hypothetical protein